MPLPNAHIRYAIRLRCDGDEWVESFPTRELMRRYLRSQRSADKKQGTETYVMSECPAIYNLSNHSDGLTWLCDCANDLVAAVVLKAFRKEA